eukprot:89550_1
MSSLSRVFYLAVALLLASSVVFGYDYKACLNRIKLDASWYDSVYGVNPFAELYINNIFQLTTTWQSSLEAVYLDNEYCVELNEGDAYKVELWESNYVNDDFVCSSMDTINDIHLGLNQQYCTDIGNSINYMDFYVKAQKSTIEPTAEPTSNPLSEDIPLHEQWDTVSYIIIGFLFITPTILLLVGLWFHHKKTGTDSPNYFAVISCFTNIADFFTDNIFWIKLIVDDNVELAVFAATFTLLPHILSIINCLYHIQKWRKMKIEYIKSNDNLIIALTVLAGFYATIDFLSSKIFHRNQTSLHFTKAQVASLKQYRFFNNILLENVPLMILQIYTLIVVNKSKDIDPITVMALVFSTASLCIGLFTLISRTFGNRSQETKSKIVCYSISLKANSLEAKHQFIHKTFSKLLSKCLEIHQNRVEVVQVLETGYGVTLKVNISLQTTEEEERIHKMMEKIQIEASDNGKDLNYLHRQLTFSSLFKSLLAKKLELDDLTDLVVIILKLKGSDYLPTNTVMMEEVINTNKQQNKGDVEMDNMNETECPPERN